MSLYYITCFGIMQWVFSAQGNCFILIPTSNMILLTWKYNVLSASPIWLLLLFSKTTCTYTILEAFFIYESISTLLH